MTVKKLFNGNWQSDITDANGRRVRRQFKTRLEANRFEKFILSGVEHSKPWLSGSDKRRLSDLIELWFRLHGFNLKDSEKRYRKLLSISKELNNPVAKKLKQIHFIEYRSARLLDGVTKKTLNNELGYLRAVYNELFRLGVIDYKNPLELVKLLQIDQQELCFLSDEQIKMLFESLKKSENPHVYLISLLCLSTGARWSEVQNLKTRQIKNSTITFVNTKNGKTRTVPIAPELAKKLLAHFKQYGLFTFSLSAFNRALARSGVVLPKGQASHVLRHTFASHFVQNGGDILTLQKILGHSSLNVTMRYAHLSRDHLTDALRFSPLSNGKNTAIMENL